MQCPQPPFPIVDAHHHLWDLRAVHYPWLEARGEDRFFGNPTPIQLPYGVRELRDDWGELPMAASVHIQVGAAPGSEVAETRWLDTQADATGFPVAIIAFADLTAPETGEVIDAHRAASKRLRGIRHIVSRHSDEDTPTEGAAMLRNPAFANGLALLEQRGLRFDLQLSAPLLPLAAAVFAVFPGLSVALCHAGSPWRRDPASLREWRAGLDAFAALPNTVCKLSGLGMFDPEWTPASLAPIVETVLDCFGPRRTMWGSNFPVDRLYRDYQSLFAACFDAVPKPDQEAVFGQTAIVFYDLADGLQLGRAKAC